ncbi:MAG TPA: DNA polymerase [Pyrinomonadaceae bacterium]|nr:DNA polymerase [Pyrinomonadaceae bacterium]
MSETDYRLITTTEELRSAAEELKQHAALGFDCETTALDPYDRKPGTRLRLVQLASPARVYLFDLDRLVPGPMDETRAAQLREATELEPLRRLLAGLRPVKVAHNAKFDAKWVRHFLGAELCGDYDSRSNADGGETVERGGLFDTLLASQIISAGEQEDRHGLGVVVERYLDQTLDKSMQLSDWGGELSDGQLEYAARDASVMLPLRDELVKQLRANALGRCAQLEFECVVPLSALELTGIHLDQSRWRDLLADIKKNRDRLHEELQERLAEEPVQQSLFGPVRQDINLDSHVQLTKALKRFIPLERLPDSTRNWKLEPLAVEYPVVREILDYRTLQKTLKFGETLLESIKTATGRIHSNFHQIGAPTGRMSSTDPNVQQIPHGAEFRRCFRAPEGRKLVTADFSQIELRILADFTNDKGFVEAFNSGADLHRVTAAQIFNVGIDDVTKQQRDFAKRLNFGVVYGIGARRFALMTGLTESDAEDLLRRYFATYRGLDVWLREAALKAVRERSAPRTVAGRLFRFNFDADDKQAASTAQRNGKNSPIQGCVRRGTRILTAEHGYVAIEEAAGLNVTVWDGREFVPAAVAPSGLKRLVRLELWGGLHVECSPDHRFWTIDANGTRRWLKAEELAERKQIYVDITEPSPEWELPFDLAVFEPKDLQLRHQPLARPHNARTLSVEAISDRFGLGLWLGRLASDGSVSSLEARRPGNIVLMVAEHEEAILPELEALTGTFGYFGRRTRVTPTQPGAFHSLTVGSISLTRQLIHYGIKGRVPDFLWKSKSALRGYLRGMFDGDGSVNPDGPVLTFGKGPDHHLEWARQIQQALLLFGIRSRLTRCRDRINVCVLKRDTPLFGERIGFMNPAKQAKLARVVPVAYLNDSKIYGRATRVKSVEVTDEWVEMYDVVDSASGRFMANGMVTHNSSADIIKRALRLLHDKLRGTGAAVVNVVHDEIVVEADAADAEEVAKTVEKAMCAAGEEYVKKVPVKVETQVSDEWAK